MAYENLLRPITLGNLEIKNRIVLAPMGTGMRNEDQTLTDQAIDYFAARARGGASLLITQTGQVSRYQSTKQMGLYDDRFIPSLRRLAAAIHENGARVLMQIGTMGGMSRGESYAPSAIDSSYYPSVPRELTKNQIEEIVGEFIQGARRALEGGFDGVELHGAHCYLVGQFMSPYFNRRTDEYGGDFEGRMRFPVEIVRGIRRELGAGFPVGLKFNAFEEVPGGIGLSLAARIARRMAKEGVVYLHAAAASTVASLTPYPASPTMYLPRNTLMPLAENTKRVAGDVPVMATGAVDDPDEAEEIIASGKADLIAIGRGLIADPEWVNHVQAGARVVPCIRCNVCQYHVVFQGKPLACSVNPNVAKEAQAALTPAPHSKKVMVVGGGPAGIVTALTASQRGHQVTLYEQRSVLGGQLVPGSTPPFKDELRRLLEYYRAEVADSNVTVTLGVQVTPELVRESAPDALILAIGGGFGRLPIPGATASHVFTADQILCDRTLIQGRNVVVIGGGDVGCEVATYLQENGKSVTVIEIEGRLMPRNKLENLTLFLEDRMRKAGVTALTGVQATRIGADTVEAHRETETLLLPADAVVFSVGLQVDNELLVALRAACDNSWVIGDCKTPARIFEAVHDGDRVGREV